MTGFSPAAALGLFLSTALFLLLVSHYRETGNMIDAFVAIVTDVAALGRAGAATVVAPVTGGPKG